MGFRVSIFAWAGARYVGSVSEGCLLEFLFMYSIIDSIHL